MSLLMRPCAGLLALLMIAGLPSSLPAADDLLAIAFGRAPFLWGVDLSPDGSKISFLHMVDAGVPVAYVMPVDGEPVPILASTPDKFDVTWCRWANNERLLCGFYGIDSYRGKLVSFSRLVAINADGSKKKVMLQDKLKEQFTQFQDEVVDWLPDDPEHVLVELPSDRGIGSTGVVRLNIYKGRTRIVERDREGTREYISDGHGLVRLRMYRDQSKVKWYYRLADSEKWSVLDEAELSFFEDDFIPVGFGADRNALLVYKPVNGRKALVSRDLLKNREDQIVFSHPEVDVSTVSKLGKYNRIVAAGYATDKSHLHYFDTDIKSISERVSSVMPGKVIGVIDESWDKRYYLIFVDSDQDPGTYYRLDLQESRMDEILSRRPELIGYKLATMEPVSYEARDGTVIPGYLSIPPALDEAHELPAVVMPHGGPESRDYWDFDWLAQYFAAKGYVVLKTNFRGSGGYGDEWVGEGAFRQWRLAINDINDGAAWLAEEGIADPARICIFGWSYGGYAALLGTLEAQGLYQCSVSVAGVTDPWTRIKDFRGFIGRKWVSEQVGTDAEVLDHGSPYRRAEEFQVPVMLFHGDKDINVTVRHSEIMHKALTKAGKQSELVIFEDVEHSIFRDEYRVDMLTRVGRFLDEYIGSD